MTGGCPTGKAQVVDNPDGIVCDYTVLVGNPPDAPLLVPAITRVIAHTHKPPGAVTADRGYGEAAVDRDLQALGVRTLAIHREGPTSPARRTVEHPAFRRLVKWRTAARDASSPSSAATAGTAPASTDAKTPRSGPETESSPTTSPRSAP